MRPVPPRWNVNTLQHCEYGTALSLKKPTTYEQVWGTLGLLLELPV